MAKVRVAVFPAAGLGTRFLPATKAQPKEMLPLVDRPLVQYVVEEARDAGIERIVIVTGRGKNAIGIGLLLSAVAATMQQAMLFSLLFIMPFSLLSGLTTPLSNMPSVLQYFTAINPLLYAIDIARRVYLEGVGLSVLTHDLLPLALIAAVTLSAASWMFGNRIT